MSPVQSFREFINERLIAAADEIFKVFEQTVVRYEEEINRQQRLLDAICKPELKIHRIELCQKEEEEEEVVPSEPQLCNQETNTYLNKEILEQIKEEQEELCTSREGGRLVLKQETDAVGWTFTNDDVHSEDETLHLNPDESQSARRRESVNNLSVKKSEMPEPSTDHQLLSKNCDLTKSQNHRGGQSGNSQITCNTQTAEKPFKCGTCSKAFRKKSDFMRHLRVHTGEKPYSCNICGRSFNRRSVLTIHKRIHTGESPFTCNTCGQKFKENSKLTRHMKRHVGERPFLCSTCGRKFYDMTSLRNHTRVHTGERPYSCDTCGKDFKYCGDLAVHTKSHTGSVLV